MLQDLKNSKINSKEFKLLPILQKDIINLKMTEKIYWICIR